MVNQNLIAFARLGVAFTVFVSLHAAAQASPPQQSQWNSLLSVFGKKAEPYYYPAKELDKRAVPLAAINPVYPEASLTKKIEGYVVLRLLINETGKVDKVEVMKSVPVGVFDSSARSAFGKARFSPALKNGAAVKSQMVVEVKYQND